MSNPHARRAAPLSEADAARLPVSDKPGTITCRATGGGTATLLLYGDIGYEVTALGVAQALASAGSVDKLDIRISSIGGKVPDGWAIFNALVRHPAKDKIVTVEGLAASMASIIAMAGTEIIMPENSYMMIHNPSGIAVGGPADMRNFADVLEHMQGVAVQTYSARSEQPPKVVAAMMEAETYMSAEQAVSLGFADRVEQPQQITAQLDLAKLPRLPAQMRAALTKKDARMSDAPPVVDPSAPPAALPAPAVPPHVEDGQPGALPVDAPLERAPNPPASPGFGPADPVAVAEACQGAGYPQLTARLLRGRATMAQVTADIDRAKSITEAATKVGQASMAAPAIAGGVDLETFRSMAFAAKANSQAPISTTPPVSQGQPQATAALDAGAIYKSMREQRAQQVPRRPI